MKETESGIQLITRKKVSAPSAVRPASATTTIRPRSGGRRAAGVASKLAKRGYRPDLRAVSVYLTFLFHPLRFSCCFSFASVVMSFFCRLLWRCTT